MSTYKNSNHLKKSRILFWNVHSLSNKIAEIYDYLKEFGIVISVESWIEPEKQALNEKNLPMNFTRLWTDTTKEFTKGRAILLIGIKNGLSYRNHWTCAESCIAKI